MAAVYLKYSPLFFFITTLAIFFSAALTSHAIPFPSVPNQNSKNLILGHKKCHCKTTSAEELQQLKASIIDKDGADGMNNVHRG